MAKARPTTIADDPLDDRERTVRLRSGGRLHFTLDVNLLMCGPEERALLFGIVDMLDAYEKAREAAKAAGGV